MGCARINDYSSHPVDAFMPVIDRMHTIANLRGSLLVQLDH
jgi:hypothetical protein